MFDTGSHVTQVGFKFDKDVPKDDLLAWSRSAPKGA